MKKKITLIAIFLLICVVSYGQNSYNLNEDRNWITSTSYDLNGNITSTGVSYFNLLGKATQSHSLDLKTGKIWVNEVRYDEFGRPVFNTLSAPVGNTYGYRSDFIKKSDGTLFSQTDLFNLTDSNSSVNIGAFSNTLGWYYSSNNTSELYQDVTSFPYSRTVFSKLSPGNGLRNLGGKKITSTTTNSQEWIQSYSFNMPMAQELFYAFGLNHFPERDQIAEKSNYNRPIEINYQDGYWLYDFKRCDGTGETFSNLQLMDNYELTLNAIYKLLINTNGVINEGYFKVTNRRFFDTGGGDDEEPQRNFGVDNFGVTKVSLIDRTSAYLCPNGRPYYVKGHKTVVRDVNGIESVIFKDSDGRVLAAARSGNEDNTTRKKYKVLSPIGEQGYVDIHIPVGCDGTVYFKGPNSSRYKIYNLITDLPVPGKENISVSTFLNAGMYRIEEISTQEYHKNENPITIISGNIIRLFNTSYNIGIEYYVNYYDYSLNEYDKAGRLIKSIQPLGFDDTLNLESSRNHELTSTFSYNSLGQLLSTTSPDEGTSNFKYREDGQIRFSQNSKQALVNEFSYTNYDEFGRPLESGVAQGNFHTLDGQNSSVTGNKEQHFTAYDYLSDDHKTILENMLHTDYHNPSFLASNVATTWNTDQNGTQQSQTFYSYDLYGRVQWMVQNLEGLGVKTIDYEYDPVTSQVLKVIYQKHNLAELFVHKYSYNTTQELVQVQTSTDNVNFTTHADYNYYETGALKRVELAEGIQGIDYVYNLAGQLKAINHPNLTSEDDPGQDPNDLFGMTLDYHTGDYHRNSNFSLLNSGNNQYNGNIKGMTWKTQFGNTENPFQYTYQYNRNNWLTEASFNGNGNQQGPAADLVLDGIITSSQNVEATNSIRLLPGFEVTSGVEFTASIQENSGGDFGTTDYKVFGITYDANGNIQTLNRNKNTENSSNRMDELSYQYKTDKPNQLKRIDDAVTIETNANDIKDQTTENNYIYNSIGQLVENIDESVKYQYNASGLVTKVLKDNQVLVKFMYNDKGFRLKKESYSSGSLSKTTYYVRDASGNPLSIIDVPSGSKPTNSEELPIYGASRLGIYNRASNTSVYQLTDHLGNVRAVIAKDGAGNAAALVHATDYYPFGMPMPNRQIVGGEPYRYAYQGQEKDPETGKEAFQLRLWDSRIGRWLTRDPMSIHHSPYLGMGNNPIIMVDPNGGYPTPYEAVLLASHVYGDNVELIGGWALSKNVQHNINDKNSGLKGALYQRELKGGGTEYAYVYAGSVELADWKNNAQQAFGNSEQYSKSLTISTDVSVAHRNQELTFVGHSLGGGLANYSSLNTGRSSITFNPAWVSNSSINNLKNNNGNTPPILQTNYVHRADPLHIFQNGSSASLLLKEIGKNIRVGGSFGSYFNGHSIGNMVKGLKPNRKVSFEFGEGTFDYD